MTTNRLPGDHEVPLLVKAIYGFAERLQVVAKGLDADEREVILVDFALSVISAVLVASDSNPLIVQEFTSLLCDFVDRSGISVEPGEN
jgi:hypothetical protein